MLLHVTSISGKYGEFADIFFRAYTRFSQSFGPLEHSVLLVMFYCEMNGQYSMITLGGTYFYY